MYSCRPLRTDEQGLSDHQVAIYYSSVLMQNVVWKPCLERWTIETSDERGSEKSVLAARHNDDDDDDDYS